MRIAAPTALLAALLAAGCTTVAGNNDAKPTPSATASASPSTAVHGIADCTRLLETLYGQGALRDASKDPECGGLSRGEYQQAVKDVLSGHTDSIIENATDEVAWDTAWESTDAAQQATVCDRLWSDGPKQVGQEMAQSTRDDVQESIRMAEYLLREKC